MARQNSGGSFDMGYSEVPNEDDIERSYEQALLRRPLAGRGRRFKIEWGAKMPQLGICCGVGLLLWVLPHPSGVTSKAWHLLSIFVATILGIALSPLPLGAVALMGLAAAMLTGTLTFQAAFSAFDSEVPWLICIAFWLSSGFIKSGLGKRLAFILVSKFGGTTLGLTYSMVFAEAVVSPAIPSTGGRNGGLIIPLAKALLGACGADRENSEQMDSGSDRRMGAYLMLSCFHGSCISSAMFSTASASNALAIKLAADVGVEITWGTWALSALAPGLLCLVLMPLIIYALFPPEIKRTPDAPGKAREELARMGPMSMNEIITLGAFAVTVTLWVAGPLVGVNNVAAALLGLGIMMVTGVISWQDCLDNHQAWDTLTWFAALIALGSALNTEGLIPWFADQVVAVVHGFRLSWQVAFLATLLIYFYSHYLFASIGAHLGSMYSAFLAVAISSGAPSSPAALALAQLSQPMGCLTVYGIASAPAYFNCGYVSQSAWCRIGAIMSAFYIVVWLTVGNLWWKLLGIV